MMAFVNWEIVWPEAERLRKEGMTYPKIANALGIKLTTIKSHMARRKYGCSLRNPIKKEEIKKRVLAGEETSKIAQALEISVWSVNRIKKNLISEGLIEPHYIIQIRNLQNQIDILFDEIKNIKDAMNG